jgi:hypothetical protein
MSNFRWGFECDIVFIDHLRIVNTSNYNSLAELHTPNITVNYSTYNVFSSQPDFQLSSELVALNCPSYNISAWAIEKTPFLYCCSIVAY